MEKKVGMLVTANVTDENEQFFFAQIEGVTYEIDKNELKTPLHIGGLVTGFAYENKNNKLQITKNIPTIRLGYYDFGTVTDVRRDLGVFVNIGLPNKDLVVSLDELPTIKELWPQRGDKLLITLRIDNKNRLWGELVTNEILNAIKIPAKNSMKGQKHVTAIVYRLKMVGTFVLTNNFNIGFIHPSERYKEPRMGEQLDARVIGVRSDGILNLSLKPMAYKAIDEDSKMILTLLKRSKSGKLPFNDKTNSNSIQEYFGISKGQFKRALGHLYKEHLIKQDENGITLNKLE